MYQVKIPIEKTKQQPIKINIWVGVNNIKKETSKPSRCKNARNKIVTKKTIILDNKIH